jgi:predicted nucleic acid-binding protein
MILADTSVVVVVERRPTPRLLKLIHDHGAAVCGVTAAELHAGATSPAELDRCAAALAGFQQVPIPDALWEAVGRNQALLRANGLTVPLVDTAIATVALAHQLELWTYDIHFAHMQKYLPGLKLFQEPL